MDAWDATLGLTCRKCGRELPSDASFCWQCGTPCHSGAKADSPELKTLHDLISDALTYQHFPESKWYGIEVMVREHPHLASLPYGKERRTALHRLVSGNREQEFPDGKWSVNGSQRMSLVEQILKIPDLPVNAQDRKGLAPLHLAITCIPQQTFGTNTTNVEYTDYFLISLQRRLIEEILTLGADPNLPDREGNTPVHFAAERGYVTLLFSLFENGGDPQVVNNRGWTPLHYATRYRYPRVIAAINEEIEDRANAGQIAPLPEPIALPEEE